MKPVKQSLGITPAQTVALKAGKSGISQRVLDRFLNRFPFLLQARIKTVRVKLMIEAGQVIDSKKGSIAPEEGRFQPLEDGAIPNHARSLSERCGCRELPLRDLFECEKQELDSKSSNADDGKGKQTAAKKEGANACSFKQNRDG